MLISHTLSKAAHVQALEGASRARLTNLQAEHDNIQLAIPRWRERLSIPVVKENGETLAVLCTELRQAHEALDHTQRGADALLAPDRTRTAEESRLLDKFGTRHDVDLTDLVVPELLASQDGRDSALDRVLAILRDLYRKNQVTIRIVRRA